MEHTKEQWDTQKGQNCLEVLVRAALAGENVTEEKLTALLWQTLLSYQRYPFSTVKKPETFGASYLYPIFIQIGVIQNKGKGENRS